MIKPKILLVDDEPDILTVTTFRLKKAGYEVITAVNGQEALDKAKTARPDMILLDLLLPIMNGYEVCKKIKSDDTLKKIPVVLFTASTVDTIEKKLEGSGADDCVIKPFEPEVLLAKIKKFIG